MCLILTKIKQIEASKNSALIGCFSKFPLWTNMKQEGQ